MASKPKFEISLSLSVFVVSLWFYVVPNYSKSKILVLQLPQKSLSERKSEVSILRDPPIFRNR